MDENNDALDISTQEVTVETTETEETVEELKARLEEERQARLKAEENYNNQKIRAEKAESRSKETTKVTVTRSSDLSSKDTMALMEAKVSVEDVDDVVEYAKFAKISVPEALKSNVVRTILSDKAEMRRTAEATATGNARRTSGKVSGETLLEKAQKGELPESDEDLQRMVDARIEAKKNK